MTNSSSSQLCYIFMKMNLQFIQKHLCSNTHRVKMLINTEAKFYSIAKTGARWYFIQLWDFKLFSYYWNYVIFSFSTCTHSLAHIATFSSHKSCSFFIYKRIILVLFIRFLPLMGFKCPRPACETYCMHHLIKSYKCSDKLCSVIFREFLTASCANSRKFVGISFSP